MRIEVETPEKRWISKSTPMSVTDIESLADSIYQQRETLDTLKVTLDDRFVILPKKILKNSVIVVIIEPGDENVP